MVEAFVPLVRRLVSEEVFGPGEFVALEEERGTDTEAQFLSKMSLANLNLRRQSGDLDVIPLFIKVQFITEDVTVSKNSNTIFYNEVLMYTEVLPLLDPDRLGNYPTLYYGHATFGEDPLKDILILKNLKPDGFIHQNKNCFLDFDHITIALKTIGKLHSFSYNLKRKNKEKFFELVKKFKHRDVVPPNDERQNLLSMKRGIEPIIKKGIAVDSLQKFLKVIEPLKSIMEFIEGPTEPFAAIIHGDYCKNNVLYKYDENGKPIDCAIFDFQYAKYGCPSVDVSFFLYMHTTAEDREQHWGEYLRIYWQSVEDNVSPDVKLPGFPEFLDYFASKAVSGYYPCSFFLPMMVFPEKILPLEEYHSLSTQQKEDYVVFFGGDEGQSLISDIVSHLVKEQYIQRFLEFYEEKSRKVIV